MTEVSSKQIKSDRTLMLVHGRDFKPAPEQYFASALAALAAGLERDFPNELDEYSDLEKRFCYYGDLTNDLLTRHGSHFDEVLDIGDRSNALAQLRLLQKRKDFSVRRYDRLPGKTAVKEFAADIIAPLLAALGFSKPLIARQFTDVSEYWFGKHDFAESLRTRVRDKITEALDRNEKLLLISHGVGSVITYDVLWQLSHDARYADKYAGKKIDTWVTLGSPLGDSMVRRRLLGGKEKGRQKYPCNVVTWQNVAAEDDHHCHDNTLADDFGPMLKQRMVSSIRDYKIYNLAVRYGKSNPHSSIGYYIHPRVSQIIVQWLKSDSQLPLPTNML